jgi:hypothetical protein
VSMTQPQPDSPPPPPPAADDAVPTGQDFMSTFFTPEMMGTENRGDDRPYSIRESGN